MANSAIRKDKTVNDAEYILGTADADLPNATPVDTLPLQAAAAADVIMFQEGGLTGDFKGTTAQQIADLAAAALHSWAVVTMDTNMAVNNGYITNKGSNANMLLPAVAAVGEFVEVGDINGGFTITQGAGQSVIFNTSTTTVGAGGSIAAAALGQTLKLVCHTANTGWLALPGNGAVFTIV